MAHNKFKKVKVFLNASLKSPEIPVKHTKPVMEVKRAQGIACFFRMEMCVKVRGGWSDMVSLVAKKHGGTLNTYPSKIDWDNIT